MLKVLMFGWELPPYNSGGLGEACLGLSKALAEKGVDVTFVMPKSQDVYIEGVKIVFADISKEDFSIGTSYTSSSEWARLFSKHEIPPDFVNGALSFANSIKRLVRKYEADIIHAHDWMTYPAAITAKNMTGKPMVAHIHSTEFDRTGGNFPNKTIYNIEKSGLIAADKVLPVGAFMADVLVKKYAVNLDKIQVVYNGIDKRNEKIYPEALNTFKKLGHKIVLFLGRITLQKGPEYFINAAQKVLRYYPKALFVVTGSGEMLPFMLQETARLGILDKFIFTGFLRGIDKDRIFQSADLFVMPSVSEPFGITALEAVANGTPILISKQSGVAEVFKNALKADFWDVDELANKIIMTLRHKPLYQDLSREGYKEVEGLNWSKSADKVIEVYKGLI